MAVPRLWDNQSVPVFIKRRDTDILFLYIAGPCIIYLIVRGDLNYIKRDTYRLGTVDTVLIYILIVAALIFGVVRNL